MPDFITPPAGEPVEIVQYRLFSYRIDASFPMAVDETRNLPYIYTEVGRTLPKQAPPNHPGGEDPALMANCKHFDLSLFMSTLSSFAMLIVVSEQFVVGGPTSMLHRFSANHNHINVSFRIKAPIFRIQLANRAPLGLTVQRLNLVGRAQL